MQTFFNRPLYIWHIMLLGALLLTAGCTSPAHHFDSIATDLKLKSETLSGPLFNHRIYLNQSALETDPQQTLHVYLDGDGSPFEARWQQPSEDPTSRNPLLLRMLAKDNSPALLVGRPCYHGFSREPPCQPALWTSRRYSQTVVDALISVLQQYLKKQHHKKLVLIGFSGGGALAALIAPYLPQTVSLITIAANLDTAAWSIFHHQPTLGESLNPQDQPPLPNSITQLHLAGALDDIIPVDIIERFVKRQPVARTIIYENQQHDCCWDKIWPEPLTLLPHELPQN